MYNRSKMNTQLSRIVTLLNVCKVLIAITILFFITILVWGLFLPEVAFTATKGVAHWELNIGMLGSFSFSLLVPFSLLPTTMPYPYMFEVKTAFITYLLSNQLVYTPLLFYVLHLVTTFINHMMDSESPFHFEAVAQLKRIAFVVIAYSIFGLFMVNLAINIFVTHSLNISLMNFHYVGLLIGLFLLAVYHLFRYGVYLQEDVDTTL
ncbi:hypothetical protein BTS2_3037 [Bacillus sp. TS-2]|nr:hypothetical protein BTS2_3037 [Bacillus sp. TS-2]